LNVAKNTFSMKLFG